MRYLVDECLGDLIVNGLRANGDDVTWVRETGRGASDLQVLEWSVKQNRIVLTEDFDYGELIFARGRPAVGVVIVILTSFGEVWEDRAAQCVRYLVKNQDAFEGNISILEQNRFKVRRLPK